jgi:hypothetical protein
MMAHSWGELLKGAQFRFAPGDPIDFFRALGWAEQDFRSSQEEAQRFGRAPKQAIMARWIMGAAPSKLKNEIRRLSGVSLLKRMTSPLGPCRPAIG